MEEGWQTPRIIQNPPEIMGVLTDSNEYWAKPQSFKISTSVVTLEWNLYDSDGHIFSTDTTNIFYRFPDFWDPFLLKNPLLTTVGNTFLKYFTFFTTLSLSGAWSKRVSKASRSDSQRDESNVRKINSAVTVRCGSKLCMLIFFVPCLRKHTMEIQTKISQPI